MVTVVDSIGAGGRVAHLLLPVGHAGQGGLQQGGEVSHPRLTGGAQQRQLGQVHVQVTLK